MIHFTIYAIEKDGQVGGIGVEGEPTKRDRLDALSYNVFSRGDTRIHVLTVSGRVTLEQQRELAINLYEGKNRRINFNDTARINIPALFARAVATP